MTFIQGCINVDAKSWRYIDVNGRCINVMCPLGLFRHSETFLTRSMLGKEFSRRHFGWNVKANFLMNLSAESAQSVLNVHKFIMSQTYQDTGRPWLSHIRIHIYGSRQTNTAYFDYVKGNNSQGNKWGLTELSGRWNLIYSHYHLSNTCIWINSY